MEKKLTGADGNARSELMVAPEDKTELAEQSTVELIGSLFSDARDLISKEIEAARLEIKTEARQLKRAVIAMVVAGFVLLLGAVMLTMSLSFGLAASDVLAEWAGFAIVGGVLALAGIGLLLYGRKQTQEAHVLPFQSAKEIRRDIKWIKDEAASASVS